MRRLNVFFTILLLNNICLGAEKKIFIQANPFDYLHSLPNISLGVSIHPKVTAHAFYQISMQNQDELLPQGMGGALSLFSNGYNQTNGLMKIKFLYADYFQTSPLAIDPEFKAGFSYSINIGYQWFWPTDIFLQGTCGLAFLYEQVSKIEIPSIKKETHVSLLPLIEFNLGYFIF